ncbi:hypothetical protein MKL29_00370 [Streptococcus suis]|nr:hypothetical protein [Streptococcus suis]
MFTLVTKKTHLKAGLIYLAISAFLILFTIVYEQYSYGESSLFMRTMFISPLLAAALLLLRPKSSGFFRNKIALLLFNSSIAIFVSAGLIKGIVEVSGRTTSIDRSYWFIGAAFLIASLGFNALGKSRLVEKSTQ